MRHRSIALLLHTVAKAFPQARTAQSTLSQVEVPLDLERRCLQTKTLRATRSHFPVKQLSFYLVIICIMSWRGSLSV